MFRSNGDIYKDDMTDITSWNDGDTINGASSQGTFDGKSCMILDSVTPDLSGSYALRSKDVGTFGTRTVFSISIRATGLGTIASVDRVDIKIYNGTNHCWLLLGTDGAFIVNAAGGIAEAGTNVWVADTWQEYTLDINFSAYTVDVSLNNSRIATGLDCAYAGAIANGTVSLDVCGAHLRTIGYVDWLKIGTTIIKPEIIIF